MKTQAERFGLRGGLAVFCLAALMTGCIFSDGGSGDRGQAAAIQGRVQGDIEVAGSASGSGSGWEGAVVTAHEINADGSLDSAHDSVTVNADGSFVLETRRTGDRKWILRARRGAEEWMARFEGRLEAGAERACRPMNLESTVETATWLELQKNENGRDVSWSEVNLAVDAEVAAAAHAAYRGGESARAELVARLAASARAASEARRAFLAEVEAQFEANRRRIDSARAEASVRLDAELHAAAGDTAQAREAERAYLAAFVDAYLKADVQRTRAARAAEASYHAMVRASANLSDSARTAMARNYARILVIASDTAVRNEFREAGAAETRIQVVAQASGRFRASVDTARARHSIDSAMARFRADVRAAFMDTAGHSDSLGVLVTVAAQTTVSNLLDSLSSSLQVQVNGSADGQAVGEAYADKHAAAQAQLSTQFSVVSGEKETEAASNLFAFLSVRSGND